MIKIYLHEGGIMPKKATEGSIAYDLYIPDDTFVKHGRNVVPLNFSLEMPIGVEAKIEPRSGFSAKGMEGRDLDRYDADVLQGKIDADYRGNVGVIIKNNDIPFTLAKGTRIAQMTYYAEAKEDLVQVASFDELSSTDRGEGGFGHSGTK